MVQRRPYRTVEEILDTADRIWWHELDRADVLESFGHHPKIGDIGTLRAKYADTKVWAENEQSGMNQAAEDTLQELAKGNQDYERKFGYIFIICATGKTATQMNDMLQARLPNDRETEIHVAMGEESKIIQIRMQKLLSELATSPPKL
mmetsp:Transcript_17322/g.28447  ORF Transcript_17322/g.28447 Transcript_17322/m.28447 type:complete len:148 (+) Transcript_17322:165-608(+)